MVLSFDALLKPSLSLCVFCTQEEYIREQIDWKEIAFNDNQPCIDLISQKPHGILRILDDQSSFPQVLPDLWLLLFYF